MIFEVKCGLCQISRFQTIESPNGELELPSDWRKVQLSNSTTLNICRFCATVARALQLAEAQAEPGNPVSAREHWRCNAHEFDSLFEHRTCLKCNRPEPPPIHHQGEQVKTPKTDWVSCPLCGRPRITP